MTSYLRVTAATPRVFLEIASWILRVAGVIAGMGSVIGGVGLMSQTSGYGYPDHLRTGVGMAVLFGGVVIAVGRYAFGELIDVILEMKATLDRR
jgi:hypothetical protein